MAASGHGPGWAPPSPSPAGYRYADLGLALLGAAAFLADLVADMWVASSYLQAGHPLWGGLVLLLLGLSSLAVQLFSWAWYRTEQHRPRGPCLAVLHLLQLGYLYRCLHALRVGWRVCRAETASQEQHFAVFLSHDISMLRLFETFLESTPQLTLAVSIVLHTNKLEPFQGLGICTTSLCVAWSLLDYHQSLRSFLLDKHELGRLSSALYFLWNFLLLCPRILAVALFATLFPSYVGLHFLGVWAVMLLWVWLQDTDFMDCPRQEWLYRATVAVILYFCWFNVTEGRTRQRSTIYHGFILVDSVLLAGSWLWYSTPLHEQSYLLPILLAALACSGLGLLLRLTYYQWFHPTLQAQHQVSYDEVDTAGGLDRDAMDFQAGPVPDLVNRRMYQLSQNHFLCSVQSHAKQGEPGQQVSECSSRQGDLHFWDLSREVPF
ncbi:XK-related protein 8 [Carettochelys insculpta]|uniref:XK-related protein 8 n=1 Tax=Carettochelys insculpta TaxID=44489 RepID=UPI003EBFB9C6